MKIAITSQNRKQVTGHAGRCRNFWIFETEEGCICKKELLELPKEQSFHESGHNTNAHPLDEVNVLISGGMGQGLVRRLQRKGIKGLVTTETDVDQAVNSFLNGTLELGEPHARKC